MFLSILPDHATYGSTLFQTAISFLMVASVWKVIDKPHRLSQQGVTIALLLCLLYYLFPMSGFDFFAYKDIVEDAGITDLNLINQYSFHLEKPFWGIINVVNNDYLLFRLVVWGSSLAFFCLAAKQMGIDKDIFVFYLCIFIVHMTAVSRVCLAISMSAYGVSFLFSKSQKRSIIKFLIGCALIGLSMFFHRSALFLLLVYPVSLVKFNKKIVWLFLALFPILIMLANTQLVEFFANDFADDSLVDATTAEYYLSFKQRTFGIGRIIYLTLEYLSIIISLGIVLKGINNGDYKTWPRYVQFFCNVFFLTSLFSMVFLFSLDGSTEKIFERLIGFAYFPQAVCLSYFFKTNYKYKAVSLVNYMIITYVLYGTLYFTLYLKN